MDNKIVYYAIRIIIQVAVGVLVNYLMSNLQLWQQGFWTGFAVVLTGNIYDSLTEELC